MTFLKRYMPHKPQKFGFLEYSLCTMNGYFLCVVVHHVPVKQKRKQRGLDEKNLNEELLLQLRLQKRYGVQGVLVTCNADCWYAQLQRSSHHWQ